MFDLERLSFDNENYETVKARGVVWMQLVKALARFTFILPCDHEKTRIPYIILFSSGHIRGHSPGK